MPGLDELFSELEMEFKKKKEQPTTSTQTQLPVTKEPQPETEVETPKSEVETPRVEESIQKEVRVEQLQQPQQQVQQTVVTQTQQVSTTRIESPKSAPQTQTAPTMSPQKSESKPGDALASIFGGTEGESIDLTEGEFSFEPEAPEPKEVWLIAGEKDDGKTHAAFSFIHRPGTKLIVCIAFDTKSSRVWWNAYNGDPRIVVFSGLRYFRYKDRDEITKAAAITYKYLMSLLDALKSGITITLNGQEILVKDPDWIVIDNTEVFMRICEFTARYNWKLPPFAGAEWKLWDERNYYVRELFLKCYDVAKKGVIYTTYIRVDDVLIEDGRPVRRKEVPKWVEAIKYETDYVVRVEKDSTGRRYYATILGSKDDKLVPVGTTFDITDVGLWPAIQQKRLKTT